MTTLPSSWVVAYGNPFDGVTLIGPFGDANEAGDYAEHSLPGMEWWTVPVHPLNPAEDEPEAAIQDDDTITVGYRQLIKLIDGYTSKDGVIQADPATLVAEVFLSVARIEDESRGHH